MRLNNMFQGLISTIFIFSTISFNQLAGAEGAKPVVLAEHSLSLSDRQSDKFVNGVFKDNILLNLAYLDGKALKGQVNWDEVRKPFDYELTLQKGETFAFHETILPEYARKVVKTTNAHFNFSEGFKSDGYLIGDGVCHLASLINWSAKDAGLYVNAPTNHDFASIPDVPRQYGVAVYSSGTVKNSADALQNLYITNNKGEPVAIKFDYNGEAIKVSVSKKAQTLVL